MSASPSLPENSIPPTATPQVAVSRWERIHAYRLLWWLGLVVFVIDQLTKTWISAKIPFDAEHYHVHHTTVIDGFFYLIHVGNTGAAWSLFAGQSLMLAILALLTLVAIYFWRRSLELRKRTVQIAFGLLCGGIIGNLVDRLVHGHVIDFLDFHFGDYVYPTFNIADAGICIGVGLYIIHTLRNPQ